MPVITAYNKDGRVELYRDVVASDEINSRINVRYKVFEHNYIKYA